MRLKLCVRPQCRFLCHKLGLVFMKKAVTTRDEFLAIVSHDLRSPLAIISMCADTLNDACKEKRLTLIECKWVETIRRNTASVNRLILDLLDVQHMASGNLSINCTLCKMNSLVNEVINSLQIVAEKNGITLKIDLPLKPLIAVADRERIRQVLANLVGNALKFTPNPGTVVVRGFEASFQLHFSVQDTGLGIAEERHEQIFERFSRLKRHDRRGVGLGLFIAKWIVEAHGGKIWLESEEGRGSTFFFSVPQFSADKDPC